MNPGNIKTRESGAWQQRPVGKRNNALGTWDGSSTPSFRDPGEVVYSTDGGTSWLPLEGATWTDGDAYPIGFIVDYNGSGTRTTPLSDNEPVPSTAGSRVEYYIGNPDSGGTLLRDDDTQPTYDAKSGAAAVTTAELGGVGSVVFYARCVYPDATIDDHTATLTIEASGGGGGGAMLSNGFTRESLLSERTGFGALAGGTGDGSADDSLLWPEYVVTDLNGTGAGSLIDAMSSGQRWVTFGVSGTVNVSDVEYPGRIVIDGRGRNINWLADQASGPTLTAEFSAPSKSNIIISYMTFTLEAGHGENGQDLIQAGAVQDAWFHHLSFYGVGANNTSDGDGALDIVHNSANEHPDRVTVSWCYFKDCNKAAHWSWTSAGVDFSGGGQKSRITSYCNRFESNRQRQSLSRGSKVHHKGVWWYQWGISDGSAGIAAQVNGYGETHIEQCIADPYSVGTARKEVVVTGASTVAEGYARDGGGNLLTNGAVFTENSPSSVFDPATEYAALGVPAPANITANQAHRDLLTTNAGNN